MGSSCQRSKRPATCRKWLSDGLTTCHRLPLSSPCSTDTKKQNTGTLKRGTWKALIITRAAPFVSANLLWQDVQGVLSRPFVPFPFPFSFFFFHGALLCVTPHLACVPHSRRLSPSYRAPRPLSAEGTTKFINFSHSYFLTEHARVTNNNNWPKGNIEVLYICMYYMYCKYCSNHRTVRVCVLFTSVY